jgi:DNA-directed RNA polymerase specialized sigma24 family protein
MPRVWNLPETTTNLCMPAAAFDGLMQAVSSEPARHVLNALSAVVAIDYVSLVEYPAADDSVKLPRQIDRHGSEQTSGRDIPYECFQRYLQHYYQQDPATALASRLCGDSASVGVAMHVQREEITHAAWRRDIYEREQLSDRLTFLFAVNGQLAWATHLYRHVRRGSFQPYEIDQLLPLANLLKPVQKAHSDSSTAPHRAAESHSLSALEQVLFAHCGQLSARERQICARISLGWPLEGIAADLGMMTSSASTLRKRAYAKLQSQGLPSDRVRLARWLHTKALTH